MPHPIRVSSADSVVPLRSHSSDSVAHNPRSPGAHNNAPSHRKHEHHKIQGYLEKKNTSLMWPDWVWKRRFFVLDGPRLCCWKDKDNYQHGQRPQSCLDLENAAMVEEGYRVVSLHEGSAHSQSLLLSFASDLSHQQWTQRMAAGGAKWGKPRGSSHRSPPSSHAPSRASSSNHASRSSSSTGNFSRSHHPSGLPSPEHKETKRKSRVRIEGYLEKRSKIMHVWQERYFVVTDKEIRWYKDQAQAQDLKAGKFLRLQNQRFRRLLSSSHIPLPGRPSERIVLEVQDPVTYETIELSFVSQDQREKWESLMHHSRAASHSSNQSTPKTPEEVVSPKYLQHKISGTGTDHSGMNHTKWSPPSNGRDLFKNPQGSPSESDPTFLTRSPPALCDLAEATDHSDPGLRQQRASSKDMSLHELPKISRSRQRSLSDNHLEAFSSFPKSTFTSTSRTETNIQGQSWVSAALWLLLLAAVGGCVWTLRGISLKPTGDGGQDPSRFILYAATSSNRDWSFRGSDTWSEATEDKQQSTWIRLIAFVCRTLVLDSIPDSSHHLYLYAFLVPMMGWIYYVASRLFAAPAKSVPNNLPAKEESEDLQLKEVDRHKSSPKKRVSPRRNPSPQ